LNRAPVKDLASKVSLLHDVAAVAANVAAADVAANVVADIPMFRN
jgi:hypothetical protein